MYCVSYTKGQSHDACHAPRVPSASSPPFSPFLQHQDRFPCFLNRQPQPETLNPFVCAHPVPRIKAGKEKRLDAKKKDSMRKKERSRRDWD